MTLQQNSTLPHDDSKHRVALLLEYVGTAYHGSQYQSHQGTVIKTVQGTLQEAIHQIQVKTPFLHFSGRTDTGVHAQGQVVHFDVETLGILEDKPRFLKAINGVLPPDIAVRDLVTRVDPRFNAQLSARSRWYRYTLYQSDTPSPFLPANALWVKQPLDGERMNAAAQQLLGTHDFKRIQGADSPNEETFCTIQYAKVSQIGNFFTFDIVSNRFLYKMVRNLMGLLVSIGKQNRPYSPTVALDAIATEDRSRPGWRTEQPDGLCLMAVLYPEPFNYFAGSPNTRFLQNLLQQQTLVNQPNHSPSFRSMELTQDESTYQIQNLFGQAS
jgi:tRNA pseudouridine38-40 synthase